MTRGLDRPALVLALPFLAMAVILRGYTRTLPVFHGSDEFVHHLPTILQFGRALPFPDLHHYPAAQTPLFHLLLACVGKLFGYTISTLRLAQVVISYLLALAVLALLRNRWEVRPRPALALTLLFTLSPYVFGQSFRLGTDNLALLFAVLAIGRLEAFRESRRPAHFAQADGCIALALLTRQSTAFLLLLALGYAILCERDNPRRLAAYGLGLALALTPAAALFLSWHGLVPIGGDPSSCGLCSAGAGRPGVQSAALGLTTVELCLSTVGIYGAVLFAPATLGRLRRTSGRRRGEILPHVRRAAPPVIAGVLLLVLAPASFDSRDAGDIWKAAHRLPVLDGSSLLFWFTVPLALLMLRALLPNARRPAVAGLLVASLLISLVVVRFAWQKYVDPYALLILLVLSRPEHWVRPVQYAGLLILLVAFIAYAADSPAHRDVPSRGKPSASSAGSASRTWPRSRPRTSPRSVYA